MPAFDEKVRRSHMPTTVRVLFIGESPPSTRRFFYVPDGLAAGLRYHTEKAFNLVFGEGAGEGEAFLQFFQSKRCYLDDLSLSAIDRLERPARRIARDAGVESLGNRIREYAPKVVVITMLGIGKYVQRAINRSGTSPRTFALPFPVHGHQQRYVDGLIRVLRQLRSDGILS